MSIFRRFSNVVQQKANAAVDRLEDPAQALDLSYQQLLEQQAKLRKALVEAATGKKRLENQAADLDTRIAKLNGQAQSAVQQNREDLATQALTQSEVLQSQRAALAPQIQTVTDQVTKLQTAIKKYETRVAAFQSQRETLKASYEASKAASTAGDTIAGIGEHTQDINLMMARAQDKIARSQAHADAVDELLASGALDTPLLGGGDALDQQLTATVVDSNVQQRLAALKAQTQGIAAPASSTARLGDAGIVVRIHGEEQYRLDAKYRPQLDDYDHRLVAAFRADDDAAYHDTLHALTEFVRQNGVVVPDSEMHGSDIILPSEDMSLSEVHDLLAQNGWIESPPAAQPAQTT